MSIRELDISKIDEGYQIENLTQGAVGHVELVIGTCENKPFKAVVKTQKKWERPGDPNSWCREYDLYISDLDKIFTNSFRWAKCYHAEKSDNETKLWLEYIEGVSRSDLTVEMYERIAEGLGRFHGKLYTEKFVPTIENLSGTDGMKHFYHYNRSKKELYNYIRQDNCKIPLHLRKMIIDMDEKSDRVWAEIEKLPIVLRHGDFFPPNLFYANDEKIILIDWDSAGLSYLGEDIVNLIADAGYIEHMVEYYHKCVPAYLNGFSEFSDILRNKNLYIHERIIMHFGYRLIDKVTWRGDVKTPDEQRIDLDILQKIYEMESKNMNITEEKLAGSLSAGTTDLLPFLPYLLQDFWELGSDPAVMAKLIKKHVDVSPETRILDLACGKGAVSVKIAAELRIKVKGIDLLPEFIEYAHEKAREFDVADICEFAIGDINEAVKNEIGYDGVILGAVGDALGNPAETLQKLKSVIKPGGYILIDEAYLPDGAKQSDVKLSHYEFLNLTQWKDLFKEAGLLLVETVGDEDNETAASGDSDTGMGFITQRANELIEKHPNQREMFEGYVRGQQNEYDDLENTLVCVTWILRKK
ncbi:MAG: methyltransferase domain-containing protein [Lachnospiraceae bacterium]|nr:methyltransferase domain-containing protein [Lachnospiraceae bacterium]